MKKNNERKKKMTIAQTVKEGSLSFLEIIKKADHVAVDTDQDWDEQKTVFTFADGSKLEAQYPNIKVKEPAEVADKKS